MAEKTLDFNVLYNPFQQFLKDVPKQYLFSIYSNLIYFRNEKNKKEKNKLLEN